MINLTDEELKMIYQLLRQARIDNDAAALMAAELRIKIMRYLQEKMDGDA